MVQRFGGFEHKELPVDHSLVFPWGKIHVSPGVAATGLRLTDPTTELIIPGREAHLRDTLPLGLYIHTPPEYTTAQQHPPPNTLPHGISIDIAQRRGEPVSQRAANTMSVMLSGLRRDLPSKFKQAWCIALEEYERARVERRREAGIALGALAAGTGIASCIVGEQGGFTVLGLLSTWGAVILPAFEYGAARFAAHLPPPPPVERQARRAQVLTKQIAHDLHTTYFGSSLRIESSGAPTTLPRHWQQQSQ